MVGVSQDREQYGKLEDRVDIKIGIFQGDSLSRHYCLWLYELKLWKNSSQIDSIVQTVWSYSENIGMKFGIDKCAVLELERGSLVRSDGIELQDGERMKD